MLTAPYRRQSVSYSVSLANILKVPGLIFIILTFTLASSRQLIVYAQQDIQGYVVGSKPVSAYACPDTNTAKCPIQFVLKPGTEVLIVDNLVGGTVPGLNDNAWRKILYQGHVLFVPMRYISLNPPGKSADSGPDISFVRTSYDDYGGTDPAFAGGNVITSTSSSFSTAPASLAITSNCNPNSPAICRQPCPANYVEMSGHCCPQGYTYNGTDCTGPLITTTVNIPGEQATWYYATDGRIDGNAGDRIAIYCRRTGRIEVWSINNSQGRFLVEFKHEAVDTAGNAGFHVNVGNQGIVTINGNGHGSYWASLSGGPFHATGTGDFAKAFHCYGQ